MLNVDLCCDILVIVIKLTYESVTLERDNLEQQQLEAVQSWNP